MKIQLLRAPDSPRLARQAALGAALLSGLATIRFLDLPIGPSGAPARNFLPQCLVHQLTGHPCPTCGMTRSFIAMSQGDFQRAVLWHPLGPALFGAAAGLALALLGGSMAARVWRLRAGEAETARASAALAAGLVIFGALRWMGGF